MLWKKKKIRKKVRTTRVNKLVTVVLKKDDISYADEAYQWNYGQILRIQGGNLPKVVEVHFSLEETSGISVTRIGTTVDGVTEVPIPDSHLENNNCSQDYTIYAYIYLEDGTAGRTEYEIAIPVKARTKPEVPGTPEEPELFRETVKAVNDAADRAEVAAQNAKASETEAGKYATSASESAATAEKTKEDALREIGEKKQEAIESIQEQEETSVGKIINHTDDEIKRILNQTAGSKRELEQTITHADASKKELDESIQTAGDTKTALDKSTELAGTAKAELDTSTQKAGEVKTALNGSARTAGEMQETLNATVKQAGALDTSLNEKIETGTQLKTDLVASGEKAVQDIQAAGSEQLGKMQAVAEEFTADREQITTNKEDISSLKDEMNKNFLDDAKTKRSLDALWKLNQGISYQFETDAERAYQKDIPSGAKLVSVKKIGGRTIVWNQLAAKQAESEHNYGLDFAWLDNGKIKISGTSTYTDEDPNVYTILKSIEVIGNHKYLFKLTGTDRFYILGYGAGDITPQAQKSIFNAPDSGTENLTICCIGKKIQSGTVIDDIVCPQIYNLTQMFGAGNEPSTPEEFEALFPEDYYPYNEGTLMSMTTNEIIKQGENLINTSSRVEKRGNNYDNSKAIPLDGNSILIGITVNAYFVSDNIIEYSIDGGKVSVTSSAGGYGIGFDLKCKAGEHYSILDEKDTFISFYGEDRKFISYVQEKNVTVPDNAKYLVVVYRPDNAGTGMKMLKKGLSVTSYSPYNKEIMQIPQKILNLDGYGDGVSDDVYNYVDWENKQYHKQVGRVDLGSLTYTNNGTASDGSTQWKTKEKISKKDGSYVCVCPAFTERRALGTIVPITNGICDLRDDCSISLGYIGVTNAEDFAQAMQGIMLYYELAEEQIIDISDIIDSTFQEPIEVEAGGTLTFHNSNGDGYRIPVPNEEEYIVSLAEVGGGASE